MYCICYIYLNVKLEKNQPTRTELIKFNSIGQIFQKHARVPSDTVTELNAVGSVSRR